jgi:hypothetical protein
MPVSPVPVDGKIQHVAAAVINGEQWLQTHGWRDAVQMLNNPKGEVFLEGLRQFRARVALEREQGNGRARAEARALLIISGLALFSIGAWIGGAIF